jgi:hypothetical protein
VAQHVLGSGATLSALSKLLWSLFTEGGGDAALTEAAVRSRVLDLAVRKSFGAKDGKPPLPSGIY